MQQERQDTVNYLEEKVNVISVKDFNCRIQLPLFNFTLPKNNTLQLPLQTITQVIPDGNWIFLKPYVVGKHVIYLKVG